MGIDIYYYSTHVKPNEKDYIWTIDELSFLHLSDIIDLYEKRTGKFVDEYGELELPPSAITPLLDCISEIIEKETDSAKHKTINKLKDIIVLADEKGRGLGFYGD